MIESTIVLQYSICHGMHTVCHGMQGYFMDIAYAELTQQTVLT